MGDFNIDLIKSNSKTNASQFLHVIYSSNLLPHITSPTHVTSKSHILIDNIFSNINEECTSGNIINTISDHLGQFLIIPNCSYSYNSKKEIFQRNFKNFKEQNFLSDLKKIDWDTVFSDCKQDVDLSYKKFLDKITKLLDIHAPVKKLSHKEKKSLSKPWLTKGILQSIKQKNVLYRKFIRTKDLTKRELLLQNLKFTKTQLTNSQELTNQITTSTILKNTKKQPEKKPKMELDLNNKTESNSNIIAETFNNFFVTIASDIDSKIIHTNTSYKEYLQGSVLNSFFLKPATKNEVISVINEMKINKLKGPNSIPTKILEISNQITCKPLTYLINLSFSNGIFPDLLKTSNVIPIFKRGENQDYNNYQPISLISNLSKLMEKIVHPRLYSFLEKNFLLFEQQYGFRNKLSTNHALIDITSKIQTACDKGIFACGVYVDFKKAFDTVNHEFLLNKLNHYGIRGIELQWFKMYLKGWQQHTTVNSFSSKIAYINYGVPQGSVLGPLLFLIYISNLNKAIKYSNVHHFVDDTNLLLSDKSLKKINKHHQS